MADNLTLAQLVEQIADKEPKIKLKLKEEARPPSPSATVQVPPDVPWRERPLEGPLLERLMREEELKGEDAKAAKATDPGASWTGQPRTAPHQDEAWTWPSTDWPKEQWQQWPQSAHSYNGWKEYDSKHRNNWSSDWQDNSGWQDDKHYNRSYPSYSWRENEGNDDEKKGKKKKKRHKKKKKKGKASRKKQKKRHKKSGSSSFSGSSSSSSSSSSASEEEEEVRPKAKAKAKAKGTASATSEQPAQVADTPEAAAPVTKAAASDASSTKPTAVMAEPRGGSAGRTTEVRHLHKWGKEQPSDGGLLTILAQQAMQQQLQQQHQLQ